MEEYEKCIEKCDFVIKNEKGNADRYKLLKALNRKGNAL